MRKRFLSRRVRGRMAATARKLRPGADRDCAGAYVMFIFPLEDSAPFFIIVIFSFPARIRPGALFPKSVSSGSPGGGRITGRKGGCFSWEKQLCSVKTKRGNALAEEKKNIMASSDIKMLFSSQ
ncbi:hypothetical protein CDAR_402141 [Caerostris darwini]|uniref:Uncharacterized protein n=1 Tax=Caerostris darwini TaxID=1538125 RepID=A0AAV4T1H0_9ARAC|nr:hypothetical protein CDAR_402141 [Caerostris darwini]